MNAATITCPKCKSEIPVEEALGHSIQEKLEKEFTQKLRDSEAEMKEKLEKEGGQEIKLLREELERKEQKLEKAREEEIALRKQKLSLEEERRSFEVEKQRQIDEERGKIRTQTEMEMLDAQRLKDKDKDKVINDLKKALEDAQRRANQGSQQSQGEVQEIDFEEALKTAFPNDEIIPIEKGKNGADVKQVVKSNSGRAWGTILWESKRQKNWSDGWLDKLKEDLRKSQADIPALVSQVLPKEISSGMGPKEGIWISSYSLAIPLAHLLRKAILDAGYQKAVKEHSGRKADLIYDLVTGNEFVQNIQALVDVYKESQELIDKERTAYEKMWKARETQNKKLISGTANLYGAIQGIAGSSAIPQIKGLDLPELESGE